MASERTCGVGYPTAVPLPIFPCFHPTAPMVLVPLRGDRAYPVFFDRLVQAPDRMRQRGLMPGPVYVVTDGNVAVPYLGGLREAFERAAWKVHTMILPPGEKTKSLEQYGKVCAWALEKGIARDRPIVALGGGVVGDLAGFAAATLLRGVPLVQLPTSLIGQVDSAVGGKTGINVAAGKNLVGAFHQPRLVLADPAVMATLPEREWTSGLAEVVKYGLIADTSFFGYLEKHFDALLAREPEAVRRTVKRCVEVKAEMVAADEYEDGRRALLNFGHTFGHALEKVAGYGRLTHGEAVAVGMRAAVRLSKALGLELDADRAQALLARLPVRGSLRGLTRADLVAAMTTDKKRRAGRLRVIVLEKIGKAGITAAATPEQLAEAWGEDVPA